MAQKIVQICDVCIDEDNAEVPGFPLDVTIDGSGGTLDLCSEHRALFDQARQLVVKHARPMADDRLHGHKLPKGETQVRCGLCGAMVGASARVSHARTAHGRAADDIDWEGDSTD